VRRDLGHSHRVALCSAILLALAGAAAAGAPATLAGNGTGGGSVPTSPAGLVPIGGPWQEFSFSVAGVPAAACGVCLPSSGGNSAFGGAPPWTFNADAGGADLTVVDAFLLGDQFEVFDFGLSLGTTSIPGAPGSGDCGDDPVPCLANPGVSRRVFQLAPGPHSITITPTLSPFSTGAAYFRIDAAQRVIPTLDAVGLGGLAVALGLASLLILRRRRAPCDKR
jgi:hypothetical protein